MKVVRLLMFVVFMVLAFGTIGTEVASAEESSPRILCLVTGCGQLSGTLKGDSVVIESLLPLTLGATSIELKLGKCEELASGKDITSCKDQDLAYKFAEVKGVKCKSEGAENGTILELLDLKLAAEETSAKVLEPLLQAKVLNMELGTEVAVTCGVAKKIIKGTFACLTLPGLANIATTEQVEWSCLLNKETHDAKTGKCVVLCEQLVEDPLMVKFGEASEDAWIELNLKGKLNKDSFIDD